MTLERENLVHLLGYGGIAGVLGTAEWSGTGALLLATPIVVWALYETFLAVLEHLTERAREDLEESSSSLDAVATDGGRRERSEVIVEGIEEHGSGAIRDEVLIDQLEEVEK